MNHNSPTARIAIIGAGSGIGLATARLLASQGHRVGVASRNARSLQSLADEFPDSVVWETLDVTDPTAPEALDRLIAKMGGMDCYLHVAGIGHDSLQLDIATELSMTDTNVNGFTRMIDSVYNYFRHHNGGRGHIAAITSVAGTNGIGYLAAYSATKRYQQTYLRALNQLSACEKLKIRFTDLRPGWVSTPLLKPGNRYPMLMNPDHVAAKIARALRRKRRVQVIDWRWNIVVGLWRLIPNALWVRLRINPGELG